jgi:hypothetical protein
MEGTKMVNTAVANVMGLSNVVLVDRANLAMMLWEVDQDIVCEVRMATEPNFNKTGNPFWDKASKSWNLLKVQNLKATLGSKTYAERVTAALRKTDPNAAPYQPEARKFGHKVDGTCWVKYEKDSNDVRWYLELSVIEQTDSVLLDNQLNPVSESLLEPFKPAQKEEGARQIEHGVDKDNVVVYRTPKLENIVSIKYLNKTYVVSELAQYA